MANNTDRNSAIFFSCSEEPAEALGELIGETVGPIGTHPDLSIFVLPSNFANSLDLCSRAAQRLLRPANLVLIVADMLPGVLGLYASNTTSAMICAASAEVTTVWISPNRDDWNWLEPLNGARSAHRFEKAPTGLLLSYSSESFEDDFASKWREIFPTSNLLVLGFDHKYHSGVASVLGRTVNDGAVLLIFWEGDALRVEPLSPKMQGLTPIGEPLTVLRAVGRTVYRLGGLPAAVALMRAALEFDEIDQPTQISDVVIGIPTDPYATDYRDGPFDIKTITDLSIMEESIELAEPIEIGTVVQFMRFSKVDPLFDLPGMDDPLRSGLLITKRQGRDVLGGTIDANSGEPDETQAMVRVLADRIREFSSDTPSARSIASALIWVASTN